MRLPDLLAAIAAGTRLPADGTVDVVAPSRSGEAAVLAFTGRTLIVADVDPGWVRTVLPDGDLSAPLCPPFLTLLAERTGRTTHGIDLVSVAAPTMEPPPEGLRRTPERDHPRVRRALSYRRDVRVWTLDEGTLILGRGVGGRREVAVEVEPQHRGRGLGRILARAARSLSTEPVWAQVAPGNAASVRAFLAAGYRPVGSESLLT
ncbi:MAG TPA: GNAT family N-acetyltransferase [Mycobacteriales bacterium]|nr:GNAT family N-acetyltransferase [Mycobacteriales bacterium]